MTDKPSPVPLALRQNLPAEPLRLADVPDGAEVRLGRLGWVRARTGRPLVSVTIRCPRCRVDHWHPWRWDWGLGDVVSFQTARCFRGPGPHPPYWVGLEARLADHNARVHAEAHEAFVAWVAMRAEAKGTGDKASDATGAGEGG